MYTNLIQTVGIATAPSTPRINKDKLSNNITTNANAKSRKRIKRERIKYACNSVQR